MTTPPDRRPDSIKITAEWNIEIPDRPPPVEPPIDPPVDPTGETIVSARNGQSWKFKGALQHGSYVNGDPWVRTAPGTTVEVMQVSHHPVDGRNGGMINPTFNDLEETKPLGTPSLVSMKQGYDSRAVQPLNVMDYDEARNAHAPLMSGGTITLKPGDSLVSAESWVPDTQINNNNSCVIARMACVTVVDYIPEADEFRPNYFGTTKIRRRCSDADLSLLPNLTAPYNPKSVGSDGFHLDEGSVYIGADAGDPHPNRVQEMEIEAVRHLQYWVYPYGGNSSVPLLKPVFQQSWYPRDNGTAYGRLAMYCMCDFEDRGKHLVSLVQLAIDAYAVAEGSSGLGAPFGGGAGYFASPLWPIRLAGLLFNDEGMKNARDIPSGNTDFWGKPTTKWGEINRVYYSTDAHPQYKMPPDYVNRWPLYGDAPTADVTHGQSSNGTAADPNGIYDAHAYKWGLPTPAYPDIMDDVYEMMLIDGEECQNLGSYMLMTNSMMGAMLSSIAMDDEAFWGGAVLDFALRFANDPQMWSHFGYEFDYSNAFENTFRRDIGGHGGSGNGWMAQMWDLILVGGRP